MPNFGPEIFSDAGFTLPPDTAMTGLSIRRGLRKAGRGIKRGAKGSARLAKRSGKFVVKLHTMPLKALGKIAKAIGKQAARPVRAAFSKTAMRRARYLSYRNRKSLQPNKDEKRQGALWAVAKFKRNPAGKLAILILKHTWGTSISGASIEGVMVQTGMTGAEIAALVASLMGALAVLIKALNKPGEAPANPVQAAQEQPEAPQAEAPGPLSQPTEAPVPESAESQGLNIIDNPNDGAAMGLY
jgi:hypothetical protein